MRNTTLLKLSPVILSALLALTPFSAAAQPANHYAATDITDLILVTGQSNVRASQSDYDPSLDSPHPRVFAFTTTRVANAYASGGIWQQADLHQAWDVDGWHPGNGSLNDPSRRPYNNFAFHFARTLAASDPDKVVGIVIASAPGEGIQHWDAGGDFAGPLFPNGITFAQAVETQALAALNAQGTKATFDAVLWHQGETDHQIEGTSDVDVLAHFQNDTYNPARDRTYYPDKLNALIARLRTSNWFSNDKPFICGETKDAPVNERLMDLNRDGDPWTGCVMGSDLGTRDGTHFNADALRTLGQRYADKYLEMNFFTEFGGKDSDTELPFAQVTSPANGTIVNAGLQNISGVASDDSSGVSRVRVRIQQLRVSPALYWNGNAWTNEPVLSDATLSDDNSIWTLPGIDLSTPGDYRIRLIAHDQAGNVARISDLPGSDFSVPPSDTQIPFAQVTTPADNADVIAGLQSISGIASDKSSGVSRVRVRIQQLRVSPALYWNGNAWTNEPVLSDATLSDDNSIWTLPGIDLSTPGDYRIRLIAHDQAGNVSRFSDLPGSDFSVPSSDTQIPFAQVTTPADNADVTAGLQSISGIASDNSSGVSRVRVRIQQLRVSPALYWNGNAWTAEPVLTDATLSGDNSTWTLPGIDLSTSGNYRIRLIAHDQAGNVARISDLQGSDLTVQ